MLPTRYRAYQLVTKSAYVLSELPWLAGFSGACAWERLRGRALDKERLEDLTARFIVRGKVGKAERRYFRSVIRKRALSPWAFPLSFLRLPNNVERKYLRTLALHQIARARETLVREHLPAGKRILDLGGAVDKFPEGMLLAMGYPHRPEQIVIVDLPDDKRMKASRSLHDNTTKDGVEIKYQLTGMTNLSGLASGSFDLVWSGQSIEHITRRQADHVIAEAFRVLKPGGRFCLDTPNRDLTRLLSAFYTHPEHKFEYTPAQLRKKLERVGFVFETAKAVVPLPISKRLRRLSKLEIIQETLVNDAVECGFCFYLQCRKPDSV